MTTTDPSEIFWKLREELNPTIFTTEWLGNQLMLIDFAIPEGPKATIEACVSGIRGMLEARRFPEAVLVEINRESGASLAVQQVFLNAWMADTYEVTEALQLHAIHCFTHVAFRYEQ